MGARSGFANLRQLDTSNWCQDHTVLPYGSAPFVCAPCSLTVRTALRSLPRAWRCRVHRNLPQRSWRWPTPLLPGQDGTSFTFDLPDGLSGIFLRAGLDDPNRLEAVAEIRACAHATFLPVGHGQSPSSPGSRTLVIVGWLEHYRFW